MGISHSTPIPSQIIIPNRQPEQTQSPVNEIIEWLDNAGSHIPMGAFIAQLTDQESEVYSRQENNVIQISDGVVHASIPPEDSIRWPVLDGVMRNLEWIKESPSYIGALEERIALVTAVYTAFSTGNECCPCDVDMIVSSLGFPPYLSDGVRYNLRQAPLSMCYLQNVNLRRAILEGADLRMSNLCMANLEGANLRGANLRGVFLRGANLIGANLQGANLQYADLRGANLMGANLQDAVMSGAIIRNSFTNLSFRVSDGVRGAPDFEVPNFAGAVMPDGTRSDGLFLGNLFTAPDPIKKY